MIYNIKAIPTAYAGVNFRSRLEARWAAFFDLCGWRWDYEPFDLEGWAPDFKLTIGEVVVLAEVKPLDSSCQDVSVYAETYAKAGKYALDYNILFLCDGPNREIVGVPVCPEERLDAFADAVSTPNYLRDWREAGNIVQWIAKAAA